MTALAAAALSGQKIGVEATRMRVLKASPAGDLILHKTGHGLGPDIHEAPQIMTGNLQRLLQDTVFTIEPGPCRTGDIGVRIEDNVVTLPEGTRSLTSFPRDLTLIGL